MPKTLFDKVWSRNVVTPETATRPAVLHVGLHLVHEVTSPQAFSVLRDEGLGVRRRDRTLAVADHSTPTRVDANGRPAYADEATRAQVDQLEENCRAFGIDYLGLDDSRRGIVHLVGPELGRTCPGEVIVCGDSHTSTHGAFGALAFGIGTTEVGHVLATQTLLQRRPKAMRVRFVGTLEGGVSAKDLALRFIQEVGIAGATGFVVEYAGEPVERLSMEGRMTLCNMSIEAGARAGMVAPDQTTFDWLCRSEAGARALEENGADWKELYTDEGADFDEEIEVDVSALRPMATYGTAPDQSIFVDGEIPAASSEQDRASLSYMGLSPGAAASSVSIDRVFVGSCTNGRLSDIEAVAKILQNRVVAPGVQMMVVPGSDAVRRDAEALGFDQIIQKAGAEWRRPGCSMCIAMNGDRGNSGETVVSTSNRNFRGRQGEGVRTILASPATAAASAVAGHLADPRPYFQEDAA